jgi:hypothetical protein
MQIAKGTPLVAPTLLVAILIQARSLFGVKDLMDYIERVLEKLKHWAGKLIEAILGPEMQPEPELIPIPVDDRRSQRLR